MMMDRCLYTDDFCLRMMMVRLERARLETKLFRIWLVIWLQTLGHQNIISPQDADLVISLELPCDEHRNEMISRTCLPTVLVQSTTTTA
jgi:hypothetical protein